MEADRFEDIFGFIEFENEDEKQNIIEADVVYKSFDGTNFRLATHKEIIKNIQDIFGDERCG